LTIAFTDLSSLEKGADVYAGDLIVGHVTDIKPNKKIDTLFVILKIDKGVKIPKGSRFYLDEGFVGPSRISIEYSNQTELLTSKDISLGISRPFKLMTPSQLDSAKLNLKKLRSPKLDTLKN